MTVGIVIDIDYPHPGEVRPRKLAQSLHQRGHRVVIICGRSGQNLPREVLDYATVYRFDYFLNSRFHKWVRPASPLNPFWVFWVAKILKKEQIDILVSSNIRAALPAILACKMLRRPIILDLQENNAEAVRFRPKTRLIHYLTKNPFLVGILERLCVRGSDHVWVVVEERLQTFSPALRATGKITVVHHTPGLDELRPNQPSPPTRDRAFTLIYVGLNAPGTGSVEIFLRALPYVLERDNRVRVLLGGGRQLEKLVQDLGIEDHVVFAGLIEPERLTEWLQQGDVGIIGYHVNSFTNTTVSVKLFQYMAAGLPVLSTAMAPTRRIIEEIGCGVVIPPHSSSREVAEIILQLKNAPNERAVMTRKARPALLEKYNWEVDFSHALACLERLVQRQSST